MKHNYETEQPTLASGARLYMSKRKAPSIAVSVQCVTCPATAIGLLMQAKQNERNTKTHTHQNTKKRKKTKNKKATKNTMEHNIDTLYTHMHMPDNLTTGIKPLEP